MPPLKSTMNLKKARLVKGIASGSFTEAITKISSMNFLRSIVYQNIGNQFC